MDIIPTQIKKKKIIFKERVLDDKATIKRCGIEDGSVLILAPHFGEERGEHILRIGVMDRYGKLITLKIGREDNFGTLIEKFKKTEMCECEKQYLVLDDNRQVALRSNLFKNCPIFHVKHEQEPCKFHDEIELTVKTVKGQVFLITLFSAQTIGEAMWKIYREQDKYLPCGHALIHGGRKLDRWTKLEDYKIPQKSTIFLVCQFPKRCTHD